LNLRLVETIYQNHKGKSSVVELIRSMFVEAGFKTASASTIRFTIGSESERNLFKMTMPGRFFLQQFLRRAANAGATHAVVEMTSEGARQFRHKGIALDALVFTNLSPEHIESHGSFEAGISCR
jgi:UDP-N-acetylmuramoyl-L-alanyl-D-glutamate--2,6-diaminopimelate ligase